MQKGFLKTTLGGRQIEHIPCPHPSIPVDLEAPAVGVLHTVEGSLGSGLSVFQNRNAPHFTLDGRRIIQLVPLGMIGLSLRNPAGGVETNPVVRAQIELAGKSNKKSWLPDEPTTAALADLLATLERAAEIPLSRPFAEKMPPLPWAKREVQAAAPPASGARRPAGSVTSRYPRTITGTPVRSSGGSSWPSRPKSVVKPVRNAP